MALIWLIEDNSAFRRATQLALSVQPVKHTCEGFESCESALAALKKGVKPNVILLDVGLPGIDGITGIQHLKALSPETTILILTVFEDDDKIFRAICAGASGYLLKAESLSTIGLTVEQALLGGSPMNPQVATRVLAMFSKLVPVKKDYGLSPREEEVLKLMVDGNPRKRIADKIDLSTHTVDFYIRSIYRKLHVNCVTEAVSVAVKDGLVSGEPPK